MNTPTNYTDLVAFARLCFKAETTFQESKETIAPFLLDKQTCMVLIEKETIATLSKLVGKRSGETKLFLASRVYDAIVGILLFGESVSYNPFTEKYENVVKRIVESQTEEKYLAWKQEKEDAAKARNKMITNPETLEEIKF